jgi:peptidoglycan biosynthesis protein MviN/MurJ (putative lipid II flippase)
MTTAFAIQFILVMLALILADICWTMYFTETANKNAVKAGIWSALIMLSGSYATVSFVNDKRFIVAAMLGAFIGTYATIKWIKRKE